MWWTDKPKPFRFTLNHQVFTIFKLSRVPPYCLPAVMRSALFFNTILIIKK